MEVKAQANQNILVEKAICFAVAKHSGQCRKGSNTPYIVHPLEVLQILHTMQADSNLLMAGVLHDTVEDTDTTLEELAQTFNEDVARLVGEHSEDKSLSWEERKQGALAAVALADKREQMLVLADKLSNIRAMERDYLRLGEELWTRFNRPKLKQAWYYGAALPALQALADYPDTCRAYEEFAQLVETVFGQAAQVQLTAAELADRGGTLYTSEAQALYWQLEQGRLTITGEDYDAEDSYEYNLALDEAGTRAFFQALHQELGPEPVDELLQKHFAREGSFYQLKAFLDQQGLVYEFFSF